ncbi:hypothetical protein BDR03DRAFT_940752 [Suillus americanus]|nr:hypothetical protein BDR03DRAFT_940752 [Suillus americanus]
MIDLIMRQRLVTFSQHLHSTLLHLPIPYSQLRSHYLSTSTCAFLVAVFLLRAFFAACAPRTLPHIHTKCPTRHLNSSLIQCRSTCTSPPCISACTHHSGNFSEL